METVSRPPKRLTPILLRIAVVVTVFAFTTATSSGAQENREKLEDEDIRNAVEAKLLFDKIVPYDAIDVTTVDGVVTLTGQVPHLLAKQRAVERAESIRGVRAVVNRLEVRRTEVSDDEVEKNVMWAINEDPATESYQIEVDVSDGTVTLDGDVDSWQEKELAGRVARSVRGVREVNNDLSWEYSGDRPDSEIGEEIESLLAASVWIDDALIDVEVEDGAVALSGSVGSAAEKRRAQARAWVAGVETVQADELDVEWWARDRMRRKDKYMAKTDEQIEQAVGLALKYDPRVSRADIDIGSDEGLVTLNGVVNNLEARRVAEQDARNTVGVFRVRNLIKVRPGARLEDERIEANVSRALSVDPIVYSFEITVDCYDGRVYLHGNVDSQYEKTRAETLAARQKGVLDVVNKLSTSPWKWKSDFEITEDVKDQFFWSPFIDADEVEVRVEDGIATLTGEVETWSEHQAATENAYEGGARRVINKIKISYGAPAGYPYYGTYYGPFIGTPYAGAGPYLTRPWIGPLGLWPEPVPQRQ